MDILELSTLDKNVDMIRFLLNEDPTLLEHVLSCGSTCKDKIKKLGVIIE